MDEHTAAAIVNRDDPIPVLQIPPPSDRDTPSPAGSDAPKKGRRDAFKQEAERLKEKLGDIGEQYKSAGGSMQDRLFSVLMQQIIPPEIGEDGTEVKDRRSRKYVDRPSFSLPTMSSNFRRFNARIGIVFVFENRLIRLFTWRVPTHTLSFLACYTLVCLRPSLLPVVPLALCLFFVMIPSFMARHPPPPSSSSDSLTAVTYSGPPVAPPTRVKPAPEMSKDFFRNMRDLQNSMEDFSRVHDSAVKYISPYTDFSDEKLSSSIFLALAALLCVAFVASHLVPWRAIAVLAGWIAIATGHPDAQDLLLSTKSIEQAKEKHSSLATTLRDWIERDIALDEAPEVREVEIFELQKLSVPAFASTGTSTAAGEWEPWLFSPNAYDLLSPARIAGARPHGTQFFEEVLPPQGWRWKDKKWSLDLSSREWVEERCVTGVEVETEGERWVYDIGYEDETVEQEGKGKEAKKSVDLVKSWEEGSGKGKRGEWRRRRWVRLVERKVVQVQDTVPRPSALKTLDPGMLNPGAVVPEAIM